MKRQTRLSLNSFLILGVLLVSANGCENEVQSNEPIVPDFKGTWTISESNVEFYISNSYLTLSQYLFRALEWEPVDIQAKEKQLEENLKVELVGMITLSPDETYESNFVKSSTNGKWTLSKDGKVLVLFLDPLAPGYVALEIVSFESGKCKLRHTEYIELDENNFLRAEVAMTLIE